MIARLHSLGVLVGENKDDLNVSSHTFRFVTPHETEALKIPNACNVCHTDKNAQWAEAALKTWPGRSPWRMAK